MQINLNPTSERGASRDAVNRPRETLGDSHLISSDPRSRFGLVCDLLCCRGNTRLCIRPGVASRAATISREAAYRRFVEQGLARAPANPFQSAAHGWLLGSETFIEWMRSLLSEPRNQDEVPAARQLASLDAAIVLAEVARYYGVDQDCFQVRRSGLLGRDLAAWLVRHHSSATLRELLPWHRRSSYEPDAPAREMYSEPSLAHRVSMCKDAKLSCRGNSPDLRLESSP